MASSVVACHWGITMTLLVVFADLPVVQPMPLRQYLPRGLHGKLDCPVDANPPPTHIEWFKNERSLDLSAFGGRLVVDRQGTLLFNTVVSSDEGRYACKPHSAAGIGRQSLAIQVEVKG